MERAMSGMSSIWGGRVLRATLLVLPLWLSGCTDKNSNSPAADTPANPLDLMVSVTGSGRVVSSPAGIDCGSDCAESLASGSNITLSATASNGFTFSGWSGDCSGSALSCDLAMSAKRAVTATFVAVSAPIPNPSPSPTPTPSPTPFPLSVSVVGTGSVTSAPSGINCGADCTENYTAGMSVTLTAVAGPEYQFFGWGGACTGKDACTVTMSSANNVTAEFTLLPTSGDAITLSLVPARTSGVAPLAVFFDASATTDPTVTTRPFHDLEYRWNFGDATAGFWANGAQAGVSSKNAATGPVAAHVFETPGTYTVSVTAFDGTNVAAATTTITVQDPNVVFADANTICVGQTILPVAGADGCPSRATAVVEPSFVTAISQYALTGRRVLFRRGDTFTAATSARIAATGPGIVGSFGSGALPLVQMTGNTNTLGFSSRSTPTFRDWRVMDLEFNGMGTSDSSGVGIDSFSGGITQVTTLRLTLRNFATAIGLSDGLINWWNNHPGGAGTTGHVVDQLAIIDSTVSFGPNTTYGGYNGGNRVAFMGNFIDNGGIQIRQDTQGNPILNAAGNLTNGSHVTRFTFLAKAVISNNTLIRPGFDRHVIKMHAATWVSGVPNAVGDNYSPAQSGDGYTKQVVISDNKFADFRNGWSLAIGPQDSASDERVRDVILERNMHVATSFSQVAQVIRAHEVTSRNNLLIGGGGSGQTLAMIDVDGAEPPASNVRIYNNTQYSADAVPSGQFAMVDIQDTRVSNITIKNNLAYAPNAQSPVLYTNVGASNVMVSNNSTDFQIKNTSPFVATPSAENTNWAPLSGGYAINHGATVPVWSDFFRNDRTPDTTDLGAVEGP